MSRAGIRYGLGRQTLPGGAVLDDKAPDASAVFTSCDRLDETVNKLAEHEDARLAPVELSAPDLCVVVEVRLRC